MGFWVEAHASVSHIGETGQNAHGPIQQSQVGQRRQENLGCARSQTVETSDIAVA